MEKKAKEIAEELNKRNEWVLVHHIDADGMASAGIMIKALERKGKEVEVKAVKQLYSETIKEIKGLGENYLFLDFGSGQLSQLKKEFGEKFIVIDHHQPTTENHPLHFNPFHFKVNGGIEVSGSGLSYLVAKQLSKENKDLGDLAIVGAVGDMQDFNGKLVGLNAEILKETQKNSLIEVKQDLRLYGRISRPITQFLLFASNPFLPGLTANKENCQEFLKKTGIPLKKENTWRSYSDLSEKEKKEFVSSLMVYLAKKGFEEKKLKELIGEVYELVKEEKKSPLRDAKEFATLLNATGRHGMSEIGLSVCLGNRGEQYRKAMALLVEHRRQLKEGIEWVEREGIQERKGFYFFDSKANIKEEIIGIIAGMLYGSGMLEKEKPVIAFAEQNQEFLKVSARATSELVKKGLNLGKILRKVCKELGGGSEGGGHAIAAGAKIPKEKQAEFLEKLDKGIITRIIKQTDNLMK
jgi:RecJ-like exonuclease